MSPTHSPLLSPLPLTSNIDLYIISVIAVQIDTGFHGDGGPTLHTASGRTHSQNVCMCLVGVWPQLVVYAKDVFTELDVGAGGRDGVRERWRE